MSGRLRELDGLRAVAVLWVLAFHYTVGTPLANPVTGLGWAGVDLFFVLSGFLITGILLDARPEPGYFRKFYARRTRRIFPAFYAVLVVYVAGARVLGGPQPWSYWAMQGAFLSSTLEFFHFWRVPAPNWVLAGVTVLWSLSMEEQFYLLWAPVVRWLRERWLWWLTAAAVAGAPLLRYHVHQAWFPEYHFFPARFDALAWGAGLALWRRRGEDNRQRKIALRVLGALAAAALAVLLAYTGGLRESRWFATLGYSAWAALCTAIIGLAAMQAGGRQPWLRVLRQQPWQHIGKVSYGLYLVHYPLLFAAGWVTASPGPRALLALAGAVGLASLSWRYLESPILKRREPSPEPPRTGVMMAARG